MVYCLVLVIYTLCGASRMGYIELQISIGDTAVRDSMLESAIRFSNCLQLYLTVLKLHYERIGDFYDIDI